MNPILLYDPAMLEQYPGLEFVSPRINMNLEAGWRARVLPFTSLSSVPERTPGPDENKLRCVTQRAYFGAWGRMSGYYDAQGMSLHDGYHRTLLLYLFHGTKSYYTLEDTQLNDAPNECAKNKELCERLDETVRQHRLHKIVADELHLLDLGVAYEQGRYASFILHPLRLFQMGRTYIPALKSNLLLSIDDPLPSQIKITPAHREALKRFK